MSSPSPTATYTIPRAASPAHEIVSTRVVPFARSRVFAAWTHPELHAKWWGPAGFTNTFFDYDVRPGGHWRFIMHGPDGTNYKNHSVFEHVVEGECIVFRHLTDPQFTVVATFVDDGEGTRIEFRMIFATAEVCAAVAHFVPGKNEENFDRIEAVLRESAADAPEFRELALLREFAASPAVVWRVLTTRVSEWWCPRPWTTPLADWDLRSGGRCRTVMRGPEGEEHDMEGIFLEVEPLRRLVFTDAYRVGWHPTGEPFMTGCFELIPTAEGRTLYRSSSRHWTREAHERHATMGFRTGWGAVADQLHALVAAEVGARAKP